MPEHAGATRTALIVSTQYWHSPFRIGSHHIAAEFARRGWRVAFLSAMLSPLHLLPGVGAMKPARWRSWRHGGEFDTDSGIWHYVPFSWMPIAYVPGLRQHWMVRNAWRFAWPSIPRMLRKAGFRHIDVAMTDHFFHAQFFPALRPGTTIYRAADIMTDYPGGTDRMMRLEGAFARNSDMVVATSDVVRDHLLQAYGIDAMLVRNGVQLDHFMQASKAPPEYDGIAQPIAVYVGAMDEWFDVPLLRACAERLPDVRFVLIGPISPEAAELAALSNVDLLGPRTHASLPGYLRHANVGLIPFRAVSSERFLDGINPLKAYEYLASGLRVVSTRLRSLPQSPALRVADTLEDFIRAVTDSLAAPGANAADAVDPAWDWSARLKPLFEAIDARGSCAIDTMHQQPHDA